MAAKNLFLKLNNTWAAELFEQWRWIRPTDWRAVWKYSTPANRFQCRWEARPLAGCSMFWERQLMGERKLRLKRNCRSIARLRNLSVNRLKLKSWKRASRSLISFVRF